MEEMTSTRPEKQEVSTSLGLSDVIVSCHHLTKRYKGCLALNEVSFDIHRGDLIGLVGKNGAGKTTLIRLLTGVATPTAGNFSLFGSDDPKQLIKGLSKVAAMIEQPALYDNRAARQNLMTRCLLMGIADPDKSGYIRDKLNFVGLPESYTDKRKVKDYSLGMRQRVGIAMAMIGEPELMILDEPTNGLDPEGIRQIRELLLRLNHEKHITIIVSSPILAELSTFASSYIFIDQGQIKEQISAAQLDNRVGKILILTTSDNLHAMTLRKGRGFNAEIVKDTLNVHDVKEPADILNALQEEKIGLLGMKEEENSLEDYFVSLVGGNQK